MGCTGTGLGSRRPTPRCGGAGCSLPVFELYEDEASDHRWRLRHRNGTLLLDSGGGYSDRSGARDGIESVKHNAPNADLEIES